MKKETVLSRIIKQDGIDIGLEAIHVKILRDSGQDYYDDNEGVEDMTMASYVIDLVINPALKLFIISDDIHSPYTRYYIFTDKDNVLDSFTF